MKKISTLVLFFTLPVLTMSFAATLPDGLYGGLGIGSMALDFETVVSGPTYQNEHFGQSDLLGHAFIGYNQNLSDWFNLSLEGFYTFYNMDTNLTRGNAFASSRYQANHNFGLKLIPAINLSGNVRIFANVGASSGNFTYDPSIFARNLGAPNRYSKNLAGFLTGVGADVALTNYLSVRGEYQNINYANWNISTPLTTGVMAKTQFNNNANQFIASLIYHFS